MVERSYNWGFLARSKIPDVYVFQDTIKNLQEFSLLALITASMWFNEEETTETSKLDFHKSANPPP